MKTTTNIWALVLAAGEGSRLKSLTTDSRGIATPKQFCSLSGRTSLLEETLERAAAVVTRSRITAVVAEQHEGWWQPMLASLPTENRMAQPENRGTGNGILLPLLQIMDRDPNAVLVLLPSDHYVRDEQTLRRSILHATSLARSGSESIMLLGIEPDKVDTELGYVLPGNIDSSGAYAVQSFVEKPPQARASQLLRDGALWNSFIVVANAQSLLDIYARRFPEVVGAMIEALASDRTVRSNKLRQLYEILPNIDFSRHVISGEENLLRVIRVPRCGWSDLGTPARVGEVVARLGRRARPRQLQNAPYFELASAYDALEMAG